MLAERVECVPRFATARDPRRSTLGPHIAATAARFGRPFMPWQQMVADVVGEIDPATGRLAYKGYVLTVPRQSGKSTFVLGKSTHRCSATKFFGPRQRLVYTAQTRVKALEKFREDYAGDLQSSSVFGPLVRPNWTSGSEHIRFRNGSRFGVEANTEKAGHGGTLDEAFIDEAFAQVDNRLEQAFRPAMITRPNTQIGVISTAGWSDGSPYLQEHVRAGRAAVTEGRPTPWAYFEWSAPQDADPADESAWWVCMPALGRTIPIEAIRAEYADMAAKGKLADFCRAYLNMWVPRSADVGWRVVAQSEWSDLAEEFSAPAEGQPVAFALDVAPDRDRAAVSVAARRDDGLFHVETVRAEAGTAWVREYVNELSTRWGAPVVADDRSAGEALIRDMERDGVRLLIPTSAQIVSAAGRFYDLTRPETRGLRHRGQPVLDKAVEAATKRNVGDAWAWDKRKPALDITPLVSATNALWGLEQGDRGPELW